MQLRMIRLSVPNPNNLYPSYDNQLETRYDFASSDLKGIYETNKDYLLKTTEKEIWNYISNDFLCNDSENMFPKRSLLTGEWYIESISFDEKVLAIQTVLLGTDLGYKDDYLGLEVVFIYDKEQNIFCVDGVNSSSK